LAIKFAEEPDEKTPRDGRLIKKSMVKKKEEEEK